MRHISQTRVHGLLCPTEAAFHFATPVEHTLAPLYNRSHVCPVSSTAAHQITTVHPYRRVVALTTVRARNSELRVPIAEFWRRLVINQILSTRWFMIGVVRFQLKGVAISFASSTSASLATQTPNVAHHYSGSAIKAVFQIVSDHSEDGQSHPARFYSAWPGHAMALTFLTHLGRDMLQTKTYKMCELYSNYCWYYWKKNVPEISSKQCAFCRKCYFIHTSTPTWEQCAIYKDCQFVQEPDGNTAQTTRF